MNGLRFDALYSFKKVYSALRYGFSRIEGKSTIIFNVYIDRFTSGTKNKQ